MLLGHDASRAVDAVFVNSPLKNYDEHPRLNDFTLPVLGLGYIATSSASRGLNVGVIDAEAGGHGIRAVTDEINRLNPRWVGLNLLAPTYRHSIDVLRGLRPDINVMLGGHQAKAMPMRILGDERIPRIDALVLGEGDLTATAILEDIGHRSSLPGTYWRVQGGGFAQGDGTDKTVSWLSPDLDALPLVDRRYLVQDPFVASDGRREANLVGSRGCPYDCAFCGAAISANPDVLIRTRSPANIVEEMEALARDGVTAFRFVDDLFLASPPFMKRCLARFVEERIGDRFVWDATGRINVLSRASTALLDLMTAAGCREVALGIESGSARVLEYMGKRITPDMTRLAVNHLTERGISVKGYFILGYPTETHADLEASVTLIHDLWEIADKGSGTFRCSAFEFRPYPGTPEWARLMATGRYTEEQLLLYEHVDLTANGQARELLDRDEFNFSVNIQFGEVPVDVVRTRLRDVMRLQHARMPHQDRVQRARFS